VKWRRGILLGGIALVVALLAAGIFSITREPHYQGKTLSEWLKSYEAAADNVRRDVAADAIRHMGTNAIPYLVEWAYHGPPGWMWNAPTYMRRLPKGSINWWLRMVIARNKASEGRLGFAILGPEIIIPALTNVVVQNPTVRLAAIRTIGTFGPSAKSAIPTLNAMLKDSDPAIRLAATNTLRKVDGSDPDLSVGAFHGW